MGAGARLRRVHRVLARRGLALPVYPSNLGATLAGWLATGGAGLNAFGPGSVLDIVRAADVVLPDGELVRFHADGRLDVAASRRGRQDAGRPPGHHGEVAPGRRGTAIARSPPTRPRPGSPSAACRRSASPTWPAARARSA